MFVRNELASQEVPLCRRVCVFVPEGSPVRVLAIVTIPSALVPVVASDMPLPSTNCTLPPELESVAVWVVASEVLATVCNSFVVLPSTSVAVMVMLPEVAEIALMPPAVIVTSVPVLLLSVAGEDVPEIERSVPAAAAAAIVTMPSNPVPVVVSVMFAPSDNCTLPPELLSVTVCVVASEVLSSV